MSTPNPDTLLRLALSGTDQDCMAEAGLLRHQVIQRAIRAAHDPVVALAHPQLSAAVRERVARQGQRRRLHSQWVKGTASWR